MRLIDVFIEICDRLRKYAFIIRLGRRLLVLLEDVQNHNHLELQAQVLEEKRYRLHVDLAGVLDDLPKLLPVDFQQIPLPGLVQETVD